MEVWQGNYQHASNDGAGVWGGAGGVEVRQLLCGSSYSTCHRYLPTLSFQHMKGPIIARLVMNAAIRAPEPERECQAFLHCKDHPLG